MAARKKVPLPPGRTQMDWMRLTQSGEDLRNGVTTLLEVDKEELKKHRSRDDAWIVLGDKVFDVTRYLEFHPGGIDELMKGAGKDATSLFQKVHPWVNVGFMLRECLVGVYRRDDS